MKTREEKLAAIEASMKRWITRQGRAATALAKLQRQKQRLLKAPTLAEKFAEQDRRIAAAPDKLPEPPGPDPFDDGGRSHSLKDDDAFAIPAELKVTTDVEALRAERRKKEAADRKAMPLTGKAALDHIRGKGK